MNNTFCLYPFLHTNIDTTGDIRLCCNSSKIENIKNISIKDYWNSDILKEVRIDLLNNKEIVYCKQCYNEEKNGIESFRLLENKRWENLLGKDHIHRLISKTNTEGYLSEDFISIDLRLGNVCNLECVMCKPENSSRLLSFGKKIEKLSNVHENKLDWNHKNNTKNDYSWFLKNDFIETFLSLSHNIKFLSFAGGEPFLSKEHKIILIHLVENNLSLDIELCYTTNCSILDLELVGLWKKFKKVVLQVSLDGTKEINDYIRYPSDTEEIIKNIHYYDNLNIDIILFTTIQILNIHNLIDFHKWYLIQNFKNVKIVPHFLHWPKYLNIKCLDYTKKQEITSLLSSYEYDDDFVKFFKEIITFLYSDDLSIHLNQTYDYIKSINNIRKMNITTDHIFSKMEYNISNKIYVINLPERTDRWENFLEYNKLYLDKFQRVDGIKNSILPKIKPNFTKKEGDRFSITGILDSHMKILESSLDNEDDLVIFEDDCYITYEGLEYYEIHKHYIPFDCDIFYLSSYESRFPKKINDFVFNAHRSLCLHSILYKGKSKRKVFESVKNYIEKNGYYPLDLIYNEIDEIKKYKFLMNLTEIYDSYSDNFKKEINHGKNYILYKNVPDSRSTLDKETELYFPYNNYIKLNLKKFDFLYDIDHYTLVEIDNQRYLRYKNSNDDLNLNWDCSITEYGTLICKNTVELFRNSNHLPFKFEEIYGDFKINNISNLKSWEGCPKIVHGNFYCNNSLEYYPYCIIKGEIITKNKLFVEIHKFIKDNIQDFEKLEKTEFENNIFNKFFSNQSKT